MLVLPANTLAGNGSQNDDESFIDVTVACCLEQILHVSAWIFQPEDNVLPSAPVRPQIDHEKSILVLEPLQLH